MTSLVGQVTQINRYPVKSLAGESLETCALNTYGLYGDRFCAFYDDTQEGWESFITARDIPNLLTYKARLLEHEISVLSPDGQIFGWNDALLNEIQRHSKKKISMTSYRAPNPEDPNLMSVDLASVLIISETSLRNLEAIWGKNLDNRRFRANLIVSIEEGAINESEWIGKRLFIGDTELEVDSYCERCSIITIDPDTLECDTSLLRKVNEQMNLYFGLYASVKKTGHIQVGENVYISD